MSDPDLERILRRKLEAMEDKVRGEEGLITMTRENFDGTVNGQKPVIVDFWADWCYPCRAMEPIFEKLAKRYGEKMNFGRLNVDEHGEIAARYRVFSIPTFLIFSKGQPIETVIGAVGEKSLEQAILKHLD